MNDSLPLTPAQRLRGQLTVDLIHLTNLEGWRVMGRETDPTERLQLAGAVEIKMALLTNMENLSWQ